MAAPVVICYAFAALMMAGVEAQEVERRRTGNVCSDDQSCPDNAFCRQAAYCVCKDGYIFVAVSDTSKVCLRVGQAGDPCDKHIQCHTMMGLHAECAAGSCACKPGAKLIGDRCYQTGVIGQRCVINQNCFLPNAEKDSDEQGFCVRGVCTCQLRYSPRDNGTRCVKDAMLNETCEDQEQCAGVGFECNGTCLCKDGFAGHIESGGCMKLVEALNDSCEFDVQCQNLVGAGTRPESALCLGGQCSCAHTAHAAGGKCWVTRRPGQSCHRDEECLPEENEPGYCLNGVCTCKTCVPDARDFGGSAAISASLSLSAILITAAILV